MIIVVIVMVIVTIINVPAIKYAILITFYA